MKEAACLWDTPKICKTCKFRKVIMSESITPEVVATTNICLREVDKCKGGLHKDFVWETLEVI